MATYFDNDRESALTTGYEAAKRTEGVAEFIEGISFNQMVENLKDWKVLAVKRNSDTIGMVIVKGYEIHVCILPEYQGRWLTKGLIKDIDQLGIKCTSAHVDNLQAQRFIERMGFVKTGTEDEHIIYNLRRLKHGDRRSNRLSSNRGS